MQQRIASVHKEIGVGYIDMLEPGGGRLNGPTKKIIMQ